MESVDIKFIPVKCCQLHGVKDGRYDCGSRALDIVETNSAEHWQFEGRHHADAQSASKGFLASLCRWEGEEDVSFTRPGVVYS